MYCRFSILAILFITVSITPRVVWTLDNGLGLTPPMGWNTWNTFYCDISEGLVQRSADILIETGLAALGYTYVNLDDCWMSLNRTSDGKYQGDPLKFPSGMAALGDYLHSKNLLFGIYSSAGTMTCARYPGSLGNELIDAQTFAEWGVDYLKYDNCFNQNIPAVDRYTTMRDALNATGRPIFYSLCEWGSEAPYTWAPAVGNAWRSTGDIAPHWSSIVGNVWRSQAIDAARSRPGAWADPDMLEVGNGNLTVDEQKTHFGLWVLAKAPLLLGMDLRTITPESLAVVKNRRLIALHQDARFPPAVCNVGCNYSRTLRHSVFVTTHDVTTVAMIVNWSSDTFGSLRISFQDMGIEPMPTENLVIEDLGNDGYLVNTAVVRDHDIFLSIPPHGNVILNLTIVANEGDVKVAV